MRYNIVLAGVGGQGILTIARAISRAAMAKGLHVKQAEVHGMSQRGGAVYSHVRISDEEIFSDLIPSGQADMVLSVEPLEALRYAPMLRPGGAVVTGTSAVANIAAYPAVAEVLGHVASFPNHIAVDMDKLGRAAGNILSANIAALGAASLYLFFTPRELEDAIAQLFEAKGQRIVDANLRAFRFGRNAATAYLNALKRGLKPREVRSWIESLPAEDLAQEDIPGLPEEGFAESILLTSGEASAFESVLLEAYDEDRKQLYEHEVYSLLELVGAISAPRHQFVPKGSTIEESVLAGFAGNRVVIKLVSQDVVHKSDVGAVRFVPKELAAVRKEIDQMVARHSEEARVAGVLVVEFVEHDHRGLGGELFVGIRSTREFGPVIAAGLGGTATEYLAAQLKPGRAVAKALASEVDAEEFLLEFKKTVAYDVLSGNVRGHERSVSDAELLRCFRAFIGIARRFCIDRGEEGPDIGELEVNPFAFREQRLLPLDGRGRLRPAAKAAKPRDLDLVRRLLEPNSIALAGVGSRPDSLGRIILNKVVGSGFDSSKIVVVKEGETNIDGVRCVPSLSELSEPVDLLVVAAPASVALEFVREANASGNVRTGIVISGGAGETEDSGSLGDDLRAAMSEGTTVFVGPNCMGLRSLPGEFDTLFVPDDKLEPRTGQKSSPVAILSQSGAFAVSRLSNLETLNPLFTVSFGNQYDATVSDFLEVLGAREDVHVAGIYMEGFDDLDGLRAVRAVQDWTSRGKTVVLYKGGRTESGRSAAAGHTAAIAGDYDICLTAFAGAGALIARTLGEFNTLLELSSAYAGVCPTGQRIFALTNAGMETVAIGDTIGDPDNRATLAAIDEPLRARTQDALERGRLGGIVSVRNPLDLTPMADESIYDQIVLAALDSGEVDAVLVSCVPLAPCLRTIGSEMDDPGAFPQLIASWKAEGKPVVFVLDAGSLYNPLAAKIRGAGVPVFRSADEAAYALSVWLNKPPCSVIPDEEEEQTPEPALNA